MKKAEMGLKIMWFSGVDTPGPQSIFFGIFLLYFSEEME